MKNESGFCKSYVFKKFGIVISDFYGVGLGFEIHRPDGNMKAVFLGVQIYLFWKREA